MNEENSTVDAKKVMDAIVLLKNKEEKASKTEEVKEGVSFDRIVEKLSSRRKSKKQ